MRNFDTTELQCFAMYEVEINIALRIYFINFYFLFLIQL